jgi:hypothetical protein
VTREGRAETAPAGRVVSVEDALPGEARVLKAAEHSLAGRRRGVAALLPFLGPAFIAAVAYVDPGNFATNVAAGSKFGYALLWVVLAANLMAMLVQSLSAKLGIATGKNLAEVCRDRFRSRSHTSSGSRPRRSRWRPTSPSSRAPRSGSRSSSRCRSSSPG